MDKLVKILAAQESNLKNFLECTMEKQNYIIDNDIKGLQTTLVTEGNLLTEMETQTERINNVIEELSKEYSLSLPENSVSEFINAVKYQADTNVKVISLLQNSIKELIMKASYIGNQNKILIEHSRNFIKETISSLVSLNNNQLLDRRI